MVTVTKVEKLKEAMAMGAETIKVQGALSNLWTSSNVKVHPLFLPIIAALSILVAVGLFSIMKIPKSVSYGIIGGICGFASLAVIKINNYFIVKAVGSRYDVLEKGQDSVIIRKK